MRKIANGPSRPRVQKAKINSKAAIELSPLTLDHADAFTQTVIKQLMTKADVAFLFNQKAPALVVRPLQDECFMDDIVGQPELMGLFTHRTLGRNLDGSCTVAWIASDGVGEVVHHGYLTVDPAWTIPASEVI